ncbi:MAG: phosphate ABC transporter permease subunit PstC [Gaiellaceae bacterium]
MSTVPSATPFRTSRRRLQDRIGDPAFHLLTLAAALLCIAVVGAIVWKLFDLAHLSISSFGLHFFTSSVWDPVKNHYGALLFLYGTAVTAFVALLIATPLSIAIGLYLSELAPRGVRGVIGSLVEMLAAIPSVVLGLWGILVLGPFMAHHLDPALQGTLGFLPMFSGPLGQNGLSMITAIAILTIMIVPIISSISRELFLSVPSELEEGALALGATRWEMVRGVILPSARSGVAAAMILGLGRALGEAIAVTQVIGGATTFHASWFQPADTLASKVASNYQSASTRLEASSLVYLALILLVMALIVNVLAQIIVRRFDPVRVRADK